MSNFSLEALLEFCLVLGAELSEQKTVTWNRRSACRSVISLLPEDQQKDVRKINPNTAVTNFHVHNPSRSEYTIREYRRRLKQTLTAFLESRDENGEFRPISHDYGLVKQSSGGKSAPVSHRIRVIVRQNFVAELLLPHDITTDEAALLSKHLNLAAEGSALRCERQG